jgi:ferredoxin
MMRGHGDDLPVSKMPVDGTYPSATAQWEKANVADQVPVWDQDLCIQCGNCSFVCPHSVIRAKFFHERALDSAPDGFSDRTDQRSRISGDSLCAAGLSRGLYRLRPVRRGMPGTKPG